MVVALASHGLSYTPDEVRAMTGDDIVALVEALRETAESTEHERAMADMRASVAAKRRRR